MTTKHEQELQAMAQSDREKVARERAIHKIERDAIDRELELMAKEDEAREQAEAARIEAERRREAGKVQSLIELRDKYVQRAELANELKRLITQFVALDAELVRANDAILGRPRIGSQVLAWHDYVAGLRRQAGLIPAHALLGCQKPETEAEAIAVTVARGIVEGYIGPAWLRIGDRVTQFDFSQNC